ncbi:hypothetical protein E4U54_000934 [Claviceps lovelessii]|nr:hypothetical protein E4U54_000934 [Claviceps lovelessii]
MTSIRLQAPPAVSPLDQASGCKPIRRDENHGNDDDDGSEANGANGANGSNQEAPRRGSSASSRPRGFSLVDIEQ